MTDLRLWTLRSLTTVGLMYKKKNVGLKNNILNMGTFVFVCVVIFIGWLVLKVLGGLCEVIGVLFALCELALGGAIIGAGLFFLFSGFSMSAATVGAVIGAVIGAICTLMDLKKRIFN